MRRDNNRDGAVLIVGRSAFCKKLAEAGDAFLRRFFCIVMSFRPLHWRIGKEYGAEFRGMRLKAVHKRSWRGVFVLRHCGEFVHHGFDVLFRHGVSSFLKRAIIPLTFAGHGSSADAACKACIQSGILTAQPQ